MNNKSTKPPKKGGIRSPSAPGATRADQWLIALFLAMLFCVPILDLPQHVTHLEGSFNNSLRTSDFFNQLEIWGSQLQAYEDHLESHATFRHHAREAVQSFLSNRVGLGNERVVITRQGLVFQEDLSWITGKGFLNDGVNALHKDRVAQSGEEILFPDPRPAILQFLKDCGDIPLILAPLPNKAMFADKPGTPTHQHPDLRRFQKAMQENGVHVFWPFETIPELGGEPFLKADTHWSPRLMEDYAKLLADYLGKVHGITPGDTPLFRRGSDQQVIYQGDLSRMLNLREDHPRFGSEGVIIRPVFTVAGEPWQTSTAAEILILGDSYLNIYSDPSMGWGSHAGLAPHLSWRLQRDLDVIARNGSAPTQTRVELARRVNPLAGKKVVLWFFAIRDLGFGNWRPVPMPETIQDLENRATSQDHQEVTVRARLITPPGKCDPQATPYTDALIYLKFEIQEVLAGSLDLPELLACFQIMENRHLTPVAKFQAGNVYELTLTSAIPDHTRNWTLLDETEAYDLDPWWVIRYESLGN